MSHSLSQTGPHHDIVISSRVRIARNVEEYPFPHRMETEKTQKLTQMVAEAVRAFPDDRGDQFRFIELHKTSELERMSFVENHLISPALAENPERGSFFLDANNACSIMINEEDHLRIQCMYTGLRLEEAWQEADRLDDWLGKRLSFAFDESFGYLTACPTNAGTGVRFSAMLHLPALTMMGYVNGLIHAASQLGFAVRGVFGEGTEYMGNLYQISNQITLGAKEQEMIHHLEDVAMQVIQKERLARKTLLEKQPLDLQDRICRSMGILRYARKLSRKEAMQYLSDIKLGVALNMISNCTLEELHDLVERIQPGNLQIHVGSPLTESERDKKRATLIRNTLAKGGVADVNE